MRLQFTLSSFSYNTVEITFYLFRGTPVLISFVTFFFLSLSQVGSVTKQICHLAYATLHQNITYYAHIVVDLLLLERTIWWNTLLTRPINRFIQTNFSCSFSLHWWTWVYRAFGKLSTNFCPEFSFLLLLTRTHRR